MKRISNFIIFIYIILPVVCFAHPAELNVTLSSDVFDIFFTSEHPDKKGMDYCQSACCCAEYTPSGHRYDNPFASMKLPRSSPYVEPPQVFIPIFVPPQNTT